MEELFRLAKSTLKEDKEIKKIKSIQRDNFHLYKNSICNLDALSESLNTKANLISANAYAYTTGQLKDLENDYIKLSSEYQVCKKIHKVLDDIFVVRQKKFFSQYYKS